MSFGINHETSHLLGFDERYTPGTFNLFHTGFAGDYPTRMMGYASMSPDMFEKVVTNASFNEIHYVDLLDFALKRGYPKNETTVVQMTGGDDTSLEIDSTKQGKKPYTEEEINSRKSRIIRQ